MNRHCTPMILGGLKQSPDAACPSHLRPEIAKGVGANQLLDHVAHRRDTKNEPGCRYIDSAPHSIFFAWEKSFIARSTMSEEYSIGPSSSVSGADSRQLNEHQVVEPGGSGRKASMMSQSATDLDFGSPARIKHEREVGPIHGSDDGLARFEAAPNR